MEEVDPFMKVEDIILAAFYDIYEDVCPILIYADSYKQNDLFIFLILWQGILDIVLVYMTEGQPRIYFFFNELAADAYFLKVLGKIWMPEFITIPHRWPHSFLWLIFQLWVVFVTAIVAR